MYAPWTRWTATIWPPSPVRPSASWSRRAAHRERVRGFLIKNMKNTVKIIEVLRNRNFLKLWIGQIVSALGDRFHQMALLGLIMKKGGNVGEELSKITFWSVLPFFLFSLFSGVLSDRWS